MLLIIKFNTKNAYGFRVLVAKYVVSALVVLYDFAWRCSAAGEGHSAGFAASDCARRAIEVIVPVPVLGAIHAAALPVLLNPVDQILLIGIIAIVLDEDAQPMDRLLLDLIESAIIRGGLLIIERKLTQPLSRKTNVAAPAPNSSSSRRMSNTEY